MDVLDGDYLRVLVLVFDLADRAVHERLVYEGRSRICVGRRSLLLIQIDRSGELRAEVVGSRSADKFHLIPCYIILVV